MKLLLGFVLGVIVGISVIDHSEAASAKIVGEGMLIGVDIVDDSGSVICSDPLWSPRLKELACDD